MTGKLKEVFGIYINDRRQQGEGMSAQEYRRIIAVDFDGTLAETKFPGKKVARQQATQNKANFENRKKKDEK